MSPELLHEFLFLIFLSFQVNRTNEQLPVIAPCGTGLHVISVSKKWDCFVFLPRTNQKDVTGLSDEDHTVWCRAVPLEIPVVIKDLEAVPEDSDDICSISILPAYPLSGTGNEVLRHISSESRERTDDGRLIRQCQRGITREAEDPVPVVRRSGPRETPVHVQVPLAVPEHPNLYQPVLVPVPDSRGIPRHPEDAVPVIGRPGPRETPVHVQVPLAVPEYADLHQPVLIPVINYFARYSG